MNFWRGRKVLLTGHTGFKGSWLSLLLQRHGADVVGLALLPTTKPNLYSLANVAEGMTSIIGDIREYDALLKVVEEHQPEIVIHMAAQALVRYSYVNPIETYGTNVMGTVNILEAARKSGCVKTIINVTTDKCYENKEWLWSYRENDRLGGHDPYSNSKACSELVTSAWRNSYLDNLSIGLASARAGNVIGGGDWSSDRLIPDIIRSCMEKKIVSIRNPNALRPWQHVLEPLSGYLILAEKLHGSALTFNSSWNFGPNEDDIKPVNWIANYIINNWNNGGSWQLDLQQQPHEATFLKLDSSKSKNKLNWIPQWGLEKGLEETINWYKNYQSGGDIRAATIDQIERYILKK